MSASYPPTLSASDEASLLALASDYSLASGLIVRPFPTTPGNPSTIPQTSALHAPYSLWPSPFPRACFDHAIDLQPLYNDLYARVTVDDDFLDEVVGGAVAKVDEFQGRLYEIYKQVKSEGVRQPLSLGLFRSDYLLHAPPPSSSSSSSHSAPEPSIKQVEFNTISSSFGCLSTRVTALHRYLLASGAYPPTSTSSEEAKLALDNLPRNGALEGLANGLAQAHRAYGKEGESVVLMVIQEGERNAFDQRPLEYELVEKHGIRLLRLTLSQLSTTLSLSPDSHTLLYTSSPSSTPLEISLVYYRTCYSPTDYSPYPSPPSPSALDPWSLRLLIERSAAIKCPSIAMQLAGSKKVQQVLASSSPNYLLERFGFSREEEQKLRESFTDLYPLDDSSQGLQALELAKNEESAQRFVLKPQREGGGNNIYRGGIPPFLAALEAADEEKERKGEKGPKGREGYILMSLIEPPQGREQVLVRAGESEGKRAEVVSELGIYGTLLLRETGVKGERPEVLVNDTVGHLLRTKSTTSDEGGVAVGHSVIDSPLLI